MIEIKRCPSIPSYAHIYIYIHMHLYYIRTSRWDTHHHHMYIYIFVYVYVCVYIYIHLYVYVYIYIHLSYIKVIQSMTLVLSNLKNWTHQAVEVVAGSSPCSPPKFVQVKRGDCFVAGLRCDQVIDVIDVINKLMILYIYIHSMWYVHIFSILISVINIMIMSLKSCVRWFCTIQIKCGSDEAIGS